MEQTLGKRIMSERKKLGLTQDQLADKLGVTAQAVSKWENDQSCPDITMLPKLSDLFGISTDELLGRAPIPPVRQGEVVEEPEETGWEVHWDAGRRCAIGFAVLVLLVGGLSLVSGLLDLDVAFWNILWPSALLVFGLGMVLYRFSFFRMGCALFGGYFLLEYFGVLDLELGELLFPIILVIFGLSLLFDALRRPKKSSFTFHHKRKPAGGNGYHTEPEGFQFTGSFGEQDQLVILPRLSHGEINTSFGEFGIDLSGVETISETCTLEASSSFGQLNLLVPRRFRVECDSHTAFAAVDTKGSPDNQPEGIITLHASINFGELCIRYL